MIFVDAGAWAAIEMRAERFHEPAMECMGRLRSGEHGILVTSDYVLDEALTFLRIKDGLDAAASLWRRAMESESVRVTYVGPETFRDAWAMMRGHRDKRWSLTDCTSFLLMRELGIEAAFTFDRNFKEAGFRVEPAA